MTETSGTRGAARAIESFRSRLHTQSLRVTRQRLAIFEMARGMRRHFSADELLETCQRDRPDQRISRATLYRTLPLLVRSRALREVLFTENHAHYEFIEARQHHEHLVCLVCGRAFEFDDAALERSVAQICRRRQFAPRSHKMEIYGTCSACQRRPSSEGG